MSTSDLMSLSRTPWRCSFEEGGTMADIDVWYAKGDRFLVQVRDHNVVVDQPRSVGGDDVGPTPTELFVASLAACVGFYAERYLRHHDLPTDGLKIRADYEMSSDRPSRVGSIALNVELLADLPRDHRRAIEAVLGRCTLHNTLMRPPAVMISLQERPRAAAMSGER
jgi:putative redox protein